MPGVPAHAVHGGAAIAPLHGAVHAASFGYDGNDWCLGWPTKNGNPCQAPVIKDENGWPVLHDGKPLCVGHRRSWEKTQRGT